MNRNNFLRPAVSLLIAIILGAGCQNEVRVLPVTNVLVSVEFLEATKNEPIHRSVNLDKDIMASIEAEIRETLKKDAEVNAVYFVTISNEKLNRLLRKPQHLDTLPALSDLLIAEPDIRSRIPNFLFLRMNIVRAIDPKVAPTSGLSVTPATAGYFECSFNMSLERLKGVEPGGDCSSAAGTGFQEGLHAEIFSFKGSKIKWSLLHNENRVNLHSVFSSSGLPLFARHAFSQMGSDDYPLP